MYTSLVNPKVDINVSDVCFAISIIYRISFTLTSKKKVSYKTIVTICSHKNVVTIDC